MWHSLDDLLTLFRWNLIRLIRRRIKLSPFKQVRYGHASPTRVPQGIHQTRRNAVLAVPPNVTLQTRLDLLCGKRGMIAIELVDPLHQLGIVQEVVLERLVLADGKRRQLVDQHEGVLRHVALLTHHADNGRRGGRLALDDGYNGNAAVLNGIDNGKRGKETAAIAADMKIDVGRLAVVLNRGLQQILLQLADLAVQIEAALLAHFGVKIDVVVLYIQGVIASHNRFDLFEGVIV